MIFSEKNEKKDLLIQNKIDLVSSYKNDPFVGHLATPINNSKIIRIYLKFLPLYNEKLSFFLKGCLIGIFHGYFLFGPFTFLGPFRNTDASCFLGFLASLSLLMILNMFSFIYGHVLYKKTIKKKLNSIFCDNLSWKKFLSGFSLGSFTGVNFAYILTKFFFPIAF